MPRLLALACVLFSTLCLNASDEPKPLPKPAIPLIKFKPKDRIVIVGDTLAERMQLFGYFEAMLHTKFPQNQFVVRNLGWSGDTPAQQARGLNFGTMTEHLKEQKPDVLFLMYGMAASFEMMPGIDKFEQSYTEWVKTCQTTSFNGSEPPRLVLVTPIAHEAINNSTIVQDPTVVGASNLSLKKYTEVIQRVGKTLKVPVVNLNVPMADFMATAPKPLTINGIHTNASGDWAVANLLMAGLGYDPVWFSNASENVRQAVNRKNEQFFLRWRAVNGEYIYGRRKEPFGVVNFPPEMKARDEIIAKLEAAISPLAIPSSTDVNIRFKNDGSTPPVAITVPVAMKSNLEVYKQSQGVIGGVEFPTAKDPAEALKTFKLPAGYAINVFASEKDFPIHNPVAMKWDAKGRLWVACNPTYPHDIPGTPPNDQIIILEDTDGDGKADKHTVFADGLYLPIGFEFGDGGVYVSAQPNLLFLKDTNNDDRADVREVVLHGFGTGDSHHSISAFHYGPDGGIYMGEGTFHRTAVEHPNGVMRLDDAGWIRFEPKTRTVSAHVSYGFANPWGLVFDQYGQNFIADASGGAHYHALPISGRVIHPNKHPSIRTILPTPPVGVRPTCGNIFVSSRHFPEDTQGDYLFNNCIGFQGVKRHKLIEKNSSYTSVEKEPLLVSSDKNFRPVDINFGPDGALYICDWFNPLVGHMQFSVRDPGRDHCHGRIYRISYPSRPLIKAPAIAGEPVEDLLKLLASPEDHTRYIVRRELQGRKQSEVLEALKTWLPTIEDEKLLLEALWVCQTIHFVNGDLLNKVLMAKEPRIRAAGVRAIRYWINQLPEQLELLRKAANDPFPLVRLEAVVACSFIDNSDAADVALEVLRHPMDEELAYALKETLNTLEKEWQGALLSRKPICMNNPVGLAYLLEKMPAADLPKLPQNKVVLQVIILREGMLADQRREALIALAKLKNTTATKELFELIKAVDGGHHGGSHASHVAADLSKLLLGQPPAELMISLGRLELLAKDARTPVIRRAAFAAIMEAYNDFAPALVIARNSAEATRDCLDAIAELSNPELRIKAYDTALSLAKVVPLDYVPATTKVTVGRHVRVLLPGGGKTLSLAEVQVYSHGKNVARNGRAKQTSTGYEGVPDRAIDGNTDGDYSKGSITHTKEQEFHPRWDLDLGKELPIDSIVIWNRTDGGYGKRLEGYTIQVMDVNNKVVWERVNNAAPEVSATFTFALDPAITIQHAAIRSLNSFVGKEKETFNTLSALTKDEVTREVALRTLATHSLQGITGDIAKSVINDVLAYFTSLSSLERTEPAGIDAYRLAQRLISKLPAADAEPFRTRLSVLGIQVITVRSVPHKMAFEPSVIHAVAGKPVVLVFENPDIMPHNWVLVKAGKTAEVGMASEAMAQDNPQAQALAYVPPKHASVLVASKLLGPQETQRLPFNAPAQVGEYEFLCTYPGHWRVMKGTLKVVATSKGLPAETYTATVAPTRAFVRNWTVEDLIADLDKVKEGRDFNKGKALFTAATCAQCHKAKDGGGDIGPALAELTKKLDDKKVDHLYVLESLIHPSKVIDDRYKQWTYTKTDGGFATGVKTFEDSTIVRLKAGPNEKEITLKHEDIETKKESKVSMMPDGLLVTFTREEILDLLAYVVSGGDGAHGVYKK